MNKITFILTRLWRYFGLYFLKPFDAVNDTLTSSLLHRLDWNEEIVEIGSGDGEYSYVMHGGKFPLWFDRYLLTDLTKSDIFDTHSGNVLVSARKIDSPSIILAIDAKESHVRKIREIGFARNTLIAEYERLPLESGCAGKIFYYTPHGLKDHKLAIKEAHRILKDKGKMLILLYDSVFKSSFLCHKLSQKVKNKRIKEYFRKLDNGRHDEITNLAKRRQEWEIFFRLHGFKIDRECAGLSTFAWKVYDIQTRPLLRALIRFFNFFPLPVRTVFKLIWMISWFPVLVIFYILFSNECLRIDRKNCYYAFELVKS